jgi:hypothetical protein
VHAICQTSLIYEVAEIAGKVEQDIAKTAPARVLFTGKREEFTAQ